MKIMIKTNGEFTNCSNDLNDPVTPDEALLLEFQTAKVRYDNASLYGIEDPKLEHEYHQAVLALKNIEDGVLRELANDVVAGGKRAVEDEQELFELSLRVRNLFPLASYLIH
jgi:hypothetical protein